jgi:hypothetical protein
VLVVAVASADAQACGEVSVPHGRALRYHAFVTKHPAQILLYRRRGTQATNAETGGLPSAISNAPGWVTIVDTP